MKSNVFLIAAVFTVFVGWIPGILIGFLAATIFPNFISWIFGFIIGLFITFKVGEILGLQQEERDRIKKEDALIRESELEEIDNPIEK